jgi:DNA helicase-2/ATP-dependent DNA helicase PcrA
LLVLAGAGSGKTRVLTCRIANLLAEGVPPERILAVTFTNKAAAEMKERVAHLVGDVAKKVWVSTFHSTCVRILRMDATLLGYTKQFSIYDDDDQVRIVRRLLDEMGFDKARTPPASILSFIDQHKNRGRGPDDVVRELRAHENDVNVRVWRAYEDALKTNDALDFNDLIGKTLTLLRDHPEARARWQGRFGYVLVDEYQDTNRTQYDVVRLISDPERNLAVVGDDDQSIYGFRGADIQNILSFEADHPDATVIRLERNYRSTHHILNLANTLVAMNTDRMAKRLWTEGDPGKKVRFVERANPYDEAEWVANAVLRLRASGRAWGEIALVYRTNATSRLFEMALRKLRIPYKVVGGRKFYERREVRDILAYLRLVVNPSDDAAFLRVVNVPARGVGAKSLEILRGEAATRGEPLLQAARSMTGGAAGARESLRAFVRLIDELTVSARSEHPAAVAERAIRQSGYLAMLDEEDEKEAESRRENLTALLRDAAEHEAPDDATSFERLSSWLDAISLTGADEEIPEGGEVTLMTVHNAKGLEYPVVFVVHMMEGQFPHSRSAELPADVAEERRLAYVAFTRAMRQLVVTWNRAGTANDVRGATTNAYTAATTVGNGVPSRFLFGLPLDSIEGDIPTSEPEAARTIARRPPGADERLHAFLSNQRQASGAAADDEEVRLVDVEDPSQLRPGVRVHHPRHGFGVVRRVDGRFDARLAWVAFAGTGPRPIELRNGGLQLVLD